MIRVDDVVVRGTEGFTLGPLRFAVAPGASLVVLGRSGAGKSVLLRALCGLAPLHAGRVALTKPVGFVFQRDALDDAMTTFDNVHDAARARGFADARARAEHALEQVGLRDARHKLPRTLSGGMRKRVGLARALVVEPRVLLADDPTAGLDPDTAREMMEQVLTSTKGTALLLATQDTDVVLPMIEDVLFLDDGKPIYHGAPPGLAADARMRAFAPEHPA